MCDLLFKSKFAFAHFPEIVDLATINCGLGMLQSNFSFVKQVGSFWDSTYWDVAPRPFLDADALAYANTLAAWNRGESNPKWASELPAHIKKPMLKSLKYLHKTNDLFFDTSVSQPMANRSQSEWLAMAEESSTSKQIVALRFLAEDKSLSQMQEALLLDKLRSPSRAVVLHSISTVESLRLATEPISNELSALVENTDDEIRAKAMIATAKLAQMDEFATSAAAKMVDSRVKYVSYAGVFALASLESVSNQVIRATDQGMVRAMQQCDYEFVGLFASAYDRWLDDPESHLEKLFQNDEPGYLTIANDALKGVREKSVSLS